MDEKDCMMGVVGKLKVLVSKHEKRPKMMQDGNREWVTLIECVYMYLYSVAYLALGLSSKEKYSKKSGMIQ